MPVSSVGTLLATYNLAELGEQVSETCTRLSESKAQLQALRIAQQIASRDITPDLIKHVARIEKDGFTIVAVNKDGTWIYRKENGVGGYQYVNESCGISGIIWDSSLGSREDFRIVAEDCYNMKLTDGRV